MSHGNYKFSNFVLKAGEDGLFGGFWCPLRIANHFLNLCTVVESGFL